MRPSLRHERACDATPVAGVDEAGRGPLAGPVVAAAVILPERGIPRGINDSKKLSPAQRARLHDLIMQRACVGVGIIEAEEIDTLNIYWATMKAMTLAVANLDCPPGHVLVDGNRLPRWDWSATAIVGGRRAVTVNRGGVYHREACSRHDHVPPCRGASALRLGVEQGVMAARNIWPHCATTGPARFTDGVLRRSRRAFYDR